MGGGGYDVMIIDEKVYEKCRMDEIFEWQSNTENEGGVLLVDYTVTEDDEINDDVCDCLKEDDSKNFQTICNIISPVLKTRRNHVEKSQSYIPLIAATQRSALSLSAAVTASFKKTKQ